jgi:beta-lactamase class A
MRARPVAVVSSLILVCLLAVAAPLEASGGSRSAPGGERQGKAQPAPTGWEWWVGQTASFINGKVASDTMRIVDLEVVTPSTFTVSMVSNTGPYTSGWYWFYDQTYSNVVSFLSAHPSQRLIDLETYVTASGRRYAFVSQTNSPAIGWWWYVGQTPSSISTHLSANHARLVDIDRYTSGGSTFYTVVMVDNTGANATAWWYWYNLTPSQVSAKISQEGSRLIAIEPGTPGRFTVVLVKNHGEYWWWTPKATASYAGKIAAQNAARIYEIEPYSSGGSTWYAAVYINDANALTTQVRELMRPAGSFGGTWGFFLKPVGHPALAGLEETFSFEPASMIKVIHFLTALRKVHNGDFALADLKTWYVNPNNPAHLPGQTNYPTDKDVCPYNPNTGALLTTKSYTDPISTILSLMMQQSDNRATDATLKLDGGFVAVNGTISTFGLAASTINHRIGCPRNSQGNPQPWQDNRFTLADADTIYEAVATNTAGLDGSTTQSFHDLMLNETNYQNSLKSSLYPIVQDEMAKRLGKPLNDPLVVQRTNQFWASFVWQAKGGSYDFCDNSQCNGGTYIYRTGGGLFKVPFKARGVTILHSYFIGSFVDSAHIPCLPGSKPPPNGSCTELKTVGDATSAASQALYRSVFHSAIATWPSS